VDNIETYCSGHTRSADALHLGMDGVVLQSPFDGGHHSDRFGGLVFGHPIMLDEVFFGWYASFCSHRLTSFCFCLLSLAHCQFYNNRPFRHCQLFISLATIIFMRLTDIFCMFNHFPQTFCGRRIITASVFRVIYR